MVGLVTAFVFLTPRTWFQDQPRIPQVSRIMQMRELGSSAYLVEPDLVGPVDESRRAAELGRIISTRTGQRQTVARIEPIYDSERGVRLYVVYTRP